MSRVEKLKEQRFIEIYNRYIDEIYQYIFMRIGFDVNLAEDITQDIFLYVYKGLNGFKGLCSERTWIYRIAKNKLADFYRKKYSQQEDILSEPEEILDGYMDTAFEGIEVRECLKKLPDQYRIVLVLKYIDENSVKNIAEILGKSPKSVESMLQRAKVAFMKLYNKKEGIDDDK